MKKEFEDYEKCILCPRRCQVNRNEGKRGVCGVDATLKVARAGLHFWEEPCISGSNGSGAVFFSGCSMHCVFCQNHEIASGEVGKEISGERLRDIFLELQDKKANNINLVTASHYLPHVIWAVEAARREGLTIPIVYNTGGYEEVEMLRRLEGIVDVYLPDYKYGSEEAGRKCAKAPDYPQIAMEALTEMVRQQPKAEFYERDGQTLMGRGVILRHLLLPGELYAARKLLREVYERFGNRIYYSIMSQYTPLPQVANDSALNQRVSESAYENLVNYATELGIENGFMQDREVARESFIPHFDLEGV
ncbi:MAG: radical SAM protein [Lachnospiraceae bacterium]|nr:radical SAM protein [Lachnospiraceae bacterium]